MGLDFKTAATQALAPLLSTYDLTAVSVADSNGDSFTITAPPPGPFFDWGWNLGGSWPSGSEINDAGFIFTQFKSDAALLSPTLPPNSGMYLRAWQTGPINQAPDASQFTQTKIWAASGFKPIMVWNTQNAPTRAKAPTPNEVTAYFTGMPLASDTGIWGVELVNEHDNPDYFSDTPDKLAMIFQVAGPILKSKGYKVIGSNALSSFGMYSNMTVQNVLKGNVDFIGRHGYEPYGLTSVADHAKVKGLADSLGLGYLSTEVGLRSANYALELPVLWDGLRKLGGIYIGFSFYQISSKSTYPYQNQPYTSPGVASANLAYIKKGLGL